MNPELDFPTRELNDLLHAAGLGHLSVDEQACPRTSDIDSETVARLTTALRQTLHAAQSQAPAIARWDATAETWLMNDDGSPESREQQERFWRAISTVLFATHALIRLGDLEVIPLLMEMARSLPGHPREMARAVLDRLSICQSDAI